MIVVMGGRAMRTAVDERRKQIEAVLRSTSNNQPNKVLKEHKHKGKEYLSLEFVSVKEAPHKKRKGLVNGDNRIG
jgi:hypothetical protein